MAVAEMAIAEMAVAEMAGHLSKFLKFFQKVFNL